MDTIKLRFIVDRDAAIRAGQTRAGETTVPLPDDLTPEQRETVLGLPVNAYGIFDLTIPPRIDGKRYDQFKVEWKLPSASDDTATSVKVLLDAYPTAVAEYRQRLVALAVGLARACLKEGTFGGWGDRLEELSALLPADLAAQLEGLRERIKAEQKAERERRERVEAEERERRAVEKRAAEEKKRIEEAERLAWIEEHGSPRLRRLVKEKFAHQAVYRDERLAIERPDWEWENDDSLTWTDPRNPPVEALELLDRARVSEPECDLWYYTWDVACYRQYGYLVTSEYMGKRIVFKDRIKTGTDEEERCRRSSN